MGHTNSTANLALPQFIGTDKPTWLSDVNGAFAAIDTYAGNNDAALAITDAKADTAVNDAASAVTTATNAANTAGTASTQATNAVTVAGNALTVANGINSKVGVLTDLTTTDKSTVVNAINEVNGKDAGDIAYDNTGSGLTATNVQDAIDEVAQGGGGGAGSALIWTNPDNTQSFASQNVQIADSTVYKYFIVFIKQRSNLNAFANAIIRLNCPQALAGVMPSDVEYRNVTATQSGGQIEFAFEDGKSHPYGTGSDTVNNSYIIPDAIYGVY